MAFGRSSQVSRLVFLLKSKAFDSNDVPVFVGVLHAVHYHSVYYFPFLLFDELDSVQKLDQVSYILHQPLTIFQIYKVRENAVDQIVTSFTPFLQKPFHWLRKESALHKF